MPSTRGNWISNSTSEGGGIEAILFSASWPSAACTTRPDSHFLQDQLYEIGGIRFIFNDEDWLIDVGLFDHGKSLFLSDPAF